MSATICPACNKPLPAAVVNGPPQAVVRCDGCQTLLLWSNGRVMRSARSSTGTMMGMPAVTVGKKDAEPPLSALEPEADPAPKPAPPKTPPPRSATQPLARVQPQKVPVTGLDNVPTRVQAPPPELLRKDAPPAAKTPAPPSARSVLPPAATPAANVPKPVAPSASKPIATPTPNVPKPVAPSASKPIATTAPTVPKPIAPSASKPIATSKPGVAAPTTPAAPTPAAPPAEDANKPQALVAAVAEVPSMSGGPMVDPSAWFSGGGDTGDVVLPEKLPAAPVVESSRLPRGDSMGAAPLPPPPQLQPLKPIEIAAPGTDLTPAIGTLMPEMRAHDDTSGPINIATAAPSRRDPTPPPRPAAAKPAAAKPTAPMDKQPSAPIKVAPTTPARKDPTPAPPKPAVPKTTMLGIPSPLREPPRAAEPVKPKQSPAAPPKSEPRRADAASADDVEVPIEIAEDDTPPRPPQAMLVSEPEPAPFPSSSTSLAPPPPAPSTSAAANAPTMMAEREISAQALPPAPSPGEPTTPMAGESVMEPDEVPARRFVMPAIPRRVLLIGGAAAALLLIVVLGVTLTRGGKHPTAATVATAKPGGPAATPEPPKPTAPIAPTPAAVAPTAPAPSGDAPTGDATPPTTPPSGEAPAAAPAPPRTRRTLGGKKVVLEYDPKPTAPTPPAAQAPVPMGEDPATVARAREAYHKGNVKLFAGDTEGAITLYRESIKIYPGYVAGYRGLGLGYEAAGNPAEALKAFRTYVKTVPNANDSPIIRRRIEHLEGVKAPTE